MFYDQAAYDVRFEWGKAGVDALAPTSDSIAIVDVLSFSTSVDIATGRGALIFPCAWRDLRAAEYAAELGALLASSDRTTPGAYTLSPASLLHIPAGTKLVLPSPNGATLSLATGATPAYAACLRNAEAVAAALGRHGRSVAVIAAGERWPDGSVRPGVEDLLGAGALIARLPGTRSPEAAVAEAVYQRFRDRIAEMLRACSSGRELIERGCAEDVALAAEVGVSAGAPALVDGAYRI